MEKKQVFISYKSEEFDEALWVKTALEQQGISCWMAPMCITGGASYAAEIPAAINNCSVFVLVLSEKVQQSKWVPRELDQAINAGKIIMPFMLEDCELKDEFKFYLSNIQRYFAYQDKPGTMAIMSREIRSVLGIPEPVVEEPPVEQPAEPEKPEQKEPVKKATPEKEPVKKATPEKEPVQAKPKKKRKLILPLIIASAVITVLLPIVLIIAAILNPATVDFAGTAIDENAYSLRVENQTVTDDDMQNLHLFANLNQICLKDCVIEAKDLSAFSSLPVWQLELENCGLTDAQLQTVSFDGMEQLSHLNLSNNPKLTDLSIISPVHDTLTHLSIGNTGIQNPDVLQSFTKLTDLSLENLGLKSLKMLSMAVYLEKLVADGNDLEDLTGLENTTILQTVSLKNNELKQVDYLANSAGTLQKVYLDHNLLQDLSCLAACTAITECSADGNLLTSMDWACNWMKLTRLSVSGNLLAGKINAPPKSNHMMFLDLSENQLTDFRGFVLEPELYLTLDLSNNRLSSVHFPANRKYKQLYLHGNPLTSLSFATGIKGVDLSIDYFDALNDAAVKSHAFNNLYIVDCPPNRIVGLEQASSTVTLLSRNEVKTQLPDPEFPDYG